LKRPFSSFFYKKAEKIGREIFKFFTEAMLFHISNFASFTERISRYLDMMKPQNFQ